MVMLLDEICTKFLKEGGVLEHKHKNEVEGGKGVDINISSIAIRKETPSRSSGDIDAILSLPMDLLLFSGLTLL